MKGDDPLFTDDAPPFHGDDVEDVGNPPNPGGCLLIVEDPFRKPC
jgi:hypothetical protein